MFKEKVRQFCPPIIWDYFRLSKFYFSKLYQRNNQSGLNVYWTHQMAEELDRWGQKNVWNEIRLLTANLQGKILDIACGTGETINSLLVFSNLDVYGFDISDYLIQRAVAKGIAQERLKVFSAVKTGYLDNFFDYSYSIGSLEHIPETDITKVIVESIRITSKKSFHMVPVSRNGKDQGWLKMRQSYHNNSVEWWLNKFKAHYKTVKVIDSAWEDCFSVGRWFICSKV